jgi:hypothetical protein
LATRAAGKEQQRKTDVMMFIRTGLVMLSVILFWTTFLLSSGCSRQKSADIPLVPPVTALPIPQGSTARVRVHSELTATFVQGKARRSTKMLVVLEADASSLRIIGLTPAGIPLFTFSKTAGGAMQTTVQGGMGSIDPARILADLQLCLWPLAILEAEMPPEFSVRQTTNTRQLERAGIVLIDVSYHGDVTSDFTRNATSGVTLHHRLLDYTIDVRPLIPVKY